MKEVWSCTGYVQRPTAAKGRGWQAERRYRAVVSPNALSKSWVGSAQAAISAITIAASRRWR